MGKRKYKRKLKAGLAPGTLVFTGEKKMEEVDFSVMKSGEDFYNEKKPNSVMEVIQFISEPSDPTEQGTRWVNIDGLHDEEKVAEICHYLELHKLTMEDILSVGQRPKLEEHENYLHIVLRMCMIHPGDGSIVEEQLSFVLQGSLLVTFQEKTGDVFENVRTRIREGKGLIRKRGAGYLLYALMDAVVDHYFVVLEVLGERLEEMELELLDNPGKDSLGRLHILRREIISLRRSVYPLREVISQFSKIEEPTIEKNTQVFIRDLYDHTIQVIETIEVFRDMATGLLDLYMNSVSNKMNEIMKVLTIIATIFIPLTFVAGVYGMNFNYMPELTWRYGYFGVMGFMLLSALLMLFYFKRKRWL